MKILICFGTRPEAIKMAPVIHELKRRQIDFKICLSAQHREMLDQVLIFFEIKANYDLNLMQPGQSLNMLSSNILSSVDKVLTEYQPNLVLVHGDTTTSVMIAWAAFHRKIKVGHIEAGLRTYNSQSPFPEELNRQITARLTSVHFAPTLKAQQNLLQEKLPAANILLTGNTVVDALELAKNKILNFEEDYFFKEIGLEPNPAKKMILVTGHRRENFGKGFENICDALLELSKNKEVEIVFPVHLNPKVQNLVQDRLKNVASIRLIPPVSYPCLLWLMKTCEFIISDSGGIQEEAPSFGKMVLVTREVSERMEGVEAGWSVLVGTDKQKILNNANKLLNHKKQPKEIRNPYGDGRAVIRIVDYLMTENE